MVKRLIVVALLVVAFGALSVSIASANGGPHGGYSATTDACAGCHRAHTATGPRLLVAATTYDLCLSCHGTGGSGADSNVIDGRWVAGRNASDTTGMTNTVNNAALLGGGFTSYQGISVTSSHDPTGATAAAWGNGGNRGTTTALAGGALTCASCHDPHGSPNYRIVRATVNATAVSVAQVDEGAAKDYDTEHWGAGQSNVCAACHSSYHRTNANQGSTVDAGTYTHRIDVAYNYGGNANPETVGMSGYTLPLGGAASDTLVCQTCHLPHGTSASMAGFANMGTPPGNTSATDSSLLRLPNRGVCEVCHQK